MESGLLSLRAELLKQKAEVNKRSSEDSFKTVTSKKLFTKEQKSVNKNLKLKPQPDVANKEELLKLEKSRKALLEKTALYDKLKNGVEVLEDDELNQKFLIDFQEKINNEVAEAKKIREIKEVVEIEDVRNPEDYKAKDSTEEWIEYTDSFGRTRTCMRKDLENVKDQSKIISENDSKIAGEVHKKWDKIEEESKSKSEIHYQDVLFDEARSHGAGFMAFSRDEEKRAEQQQYLKDLGAQTEQIKVSKNALKVKREKLMKERLAKVRQKKRLKMGLPMNDEEKYKTPPTSDEENINEDQVSEGIKDVITTYESKNEPCEERDLHVREWDIGKPGVSALMSQEQWIESKRKNRENEFAPPTKYENYTKTPQAKQKYSDKNPKKRNELDMNIETEERCSNYAPPSTYEYYGPSTFKNKHSFKKIDMETAIEKGLSEIRNLQPNTSELF